MELIDPRAVSTRIIFVRDSVASRVWHLADVAISKAVGASVYHMALHGAYVYPGTKADTVAEARKLTGPGDRFCERCLEEFELARDVIEKRKMMKFQ